jgi:hypothetical protein
MFHATTNRRPASAAIGTQATSGANTTTARSTNTAWVIAAIGDRAPDRMLVAVRASAPVAAMPPKNGAAMLPRPRPMSSASGSWRVPVMPSAITADSNDSMAPRIAIVNAGGRRSRSAVRWKRSAFHGTRGVGGTGGMPANT